MYEGKEEVNVDSLLFSNGYYDEGAARRVGDKDPIHTAIGFRSGPANPSHGIPIDKFIRYHYTRDPASIRKRNIKGLTPLHVAGMQRNLLVIKTLLDLGAEDDLDDWKNTEGKTPVEFAEYVMKAEREANDRMRKPWKGYSDGDLEAVWTLRHEAGEDVGTLQDFIKQRKWGCTCGQCSDGWFSRRMRYRISCKLFSFARD